MKTYRSAGSNLCILFFIKNFTKLVKKSTHFIDNRLIHDVIDGMMWTNPHLPVLSQQHTFSSFIWI